MKRALMLGLAVAIAGLSLPALADEGLGDQAETGTGISKSGRVVKEGAKYNQRMKRAKEIKGITKRNREAGQRERTRGMYRQAEGQIDGSWKKINQGVKQKARGKKIINKANRIDKIVDKTVTRTKKKVTKRAE